MEVDSQFANREFSLYGKENQWIDGAMPLSETKRVNLIMEIFVTLQKIGNSNVLIIK